MTVNVKTDIREATRYLRGIEREAIPQATRRSLNRTGQQVQSAAVRLVASEMGLKQKDARASIKIIRATRTLLAATVEASGRALNLIRFSASQAKAGVRAKAWGKTKTYPGTFIANQGRTVFKRTGKDRLPIKPVWGPSVTGIFKSKPVQAEILKVAGLRWPINFAADLKYYLSKVRGR